MSVHILSTAERHSGVVNDVEEVLRASNLLATHNQVSAVDLDALARTVRGSEARVFVCVGTAHLASVVSALTKKPVIGVPVAEKGAHSDAVIGMTHAPEGAPVAVVGAEQGKNAAYLALRMLGVEHAGVEKVEEFAAAPTVEGFGGFFDQVASEPAPSLNTASEEPEKRVVRKERGTGEWGI